MPSAVTWRCASSSTGTWHKCTLWTGSEELSGAGFFNPTAEDKPEHLGINLLEQGTQGSFSERREIPSVRSSGTRGWPCPRALLPCGLLAHTTSRLLGAGSSQCAGRVGTSAATQHTGAQRVYGVSWPPNTAWWHVRVFYRSQRTFLLLSCAMKWCRARTLGTFLFILKVGIKFTAERQTANLLSPLSSWVSEFE